MPMFKVDDNAIEILKKAKEEMRAQGIASPSYSDAIRYLAQKAEKAR